MDKKCVYDVYAEPQDVKRNDKLPKKLNEVEDDDKYVNYLEAHGILRFILN